MDGIAVPSATRWRTSAVTRFLALVALHGLVNFALLPASAIVAHPVHPADYGVLAGWGAQPAYVAMNLLVVLCVFLCLRFVELWVRRGQPLPWLGFLAAGAMALGFAFIVDWTKFFGLLGNLGAAALGLGALCAIAALHNDGSRAPFLVPATFLLAASSALASADWIVPILIASASAALVSAHARTKWLGVIAGLAVLFVAVIAFAHGTGVAPAGALRNYARLLFATSAGILIVVLAIALVIAALVKRRRDRDTSIQLFALLPIAAGALAPIAMSASYPYGYYAFLPLALLSATCAAALYHLVQPLPIESTPTRAWSSRFGSAPFPARRPLAKGDVLVSLALALGAFLWIAHLESLYPERFYVIRNIWFGADHFRVLSNMSNQVVSHWRTHVHPLFSLVAYPLTHALMALGLSPVTAANTILAGSGSIAVAMTYAASRAIGLAVVDAVLVAFAFMASAAFVFWFGLIESFPIGAATLAAMILIAALRPASTLAWILGNAVTLSITTTNWVLGVLATYFGNSRRRFVVITASALLGVGALAFLQKGLFPTSRLFFVPSTVSEETHWFAIRSIDSSTPAIIGTRLVNLFVYTGVNPLPRASSPLKSDGINVDTILAHPPLALGTHSLPGIVGTVSWLAMLSIGLAACFTQRSLAHVTVPVLGFLAFQTLLHTVWGDEPFLYSAHFLPPLIAVCAVGLTGRYASASRLALVAFVASAGVANYATFLASIGFVRRTLGLA